MAGKFSSKRSKLGRFAFFSRMLVLVLHLLIGASLLFLAADTIFAWNVVESECEAASLFESGQLMIESFSGPWGAVAFGGARFFGGAGAWLFLTGSLALVVAWGLHRRQVWPYFLLLGVCLLGFPAVLYASFYLAMHFGFSGFEAFPLQLLVITVYWAVFYLLVAMSFMADRKRTHPGLAPDVL